MTAMSRVVHFEINTDDPERAAAFYRELFGWKITKWDSDAMDYWMVDTGEEGPGINGGLLKRPHSNYSTVNTVNVEDLDAALRKVKSAGGQVTSPKFPVAGVGWLAYATDTEGNVFGILQPDESAK
jgi:predicted enzyme related to lactoylglutathione lyase